MGTATKGMSTVDASSRVVMKPKAPGQTPSIKAQPTSQSKSDVTTAKLPNGTDWAAHHDHQTLMDAEHIKADPVKMHKVRQIAGRKEMSASAIKNVADIKSAGKALRAGKLPKEGSNPEDPAKRFPSGEMDPEAESHYGTLHRAEEIKQSPSRMDGVRKVAGAKHAAAKSVADSVYGKGSGNKDYDQDND